jgi:hypothetical protein
VDNGDPWEEWDDVLGGLDPEIDAELYEAAVDRAMTLEIGLAARCHVGLDQVLHAALTALTGSTMPPGTPTARLIARIEDTLTSSPLPGSTTNEKARDALSAARLANQHRNRVLHDQWMAVIDDDGPHLEHIRTDVAGDRIQPSRETLSAITSVSAELSAAYYRILGILLFAKLSDGLPTPEVEARCERALRLISGANRPVAPAKETDTPPWDDDEPPF